MFRIVRQTLLSSQTRLPKPNMTHSRSNQNYYVHGHDDAVLTSHRSRTVDNSAAFVKPLLLDSTSVLDCGCGPGTITADFKRYCPFGDIVGIDQEQKIIQKAGREFPQVRFVQGGVTALPFDDNTFDLVYTNIVLEYVSDTRAALREMHRVCKPGGHVALRSSDSGFYLQAPVFSQGFDEFRRCWAEGIAKSGGRPYISRELPQILSDLRLFRSVDISVSTYHFCTKSERQWWADIWTARLTRGQMVDTWKTNGIATDYQIGMMKQSFNVLRTSDIGFFILPFTEFLCKK